MQTLAQEFGTPLFVYSKNFFVDRYKEFDEVFKSIKYMIFFASKTNFNLSVFKIFHELGSGDDVNSVGEFYRAIKVELYKKVQSAGIPLKHFDIGGGIGVLYNNENPVTPKELADRLIPIFM